MKRKNHVFTLIELFFVIGIIALLITILLPALGGAKQVSVRTQGAPNLKNCARGSYALTADWHVRLMSTTRNVTRAEVFSSEQTTYNPDHVSGVSSTIAEALVDTEADLLCFVCPSHAAYPQGSMVLLISENSATTLLDLNASGSNIARLIASVQFQAIWDLAPFDGSISAVTTGYWPEVGAYGKIECVLSTREPNPLFSFASIYKRC